MHGRLGKKDLDSYCIKPCLRVMVSFCMQFEKIVDEALLAWIDMISLFFSGPFNYIRAAGLYQSESLASEPLITILSKGQRWDITNEKIICLYSYGFFRLEISVEVVRQVLHEKQ